MESIQDLITARDASNRPADVRIIRLSWGKLLSLSLLLVLIFGVCIGAVVYSVVWTRKKQEVTALQNQNAYLAAVLDDFATRIGDIKRKLLYLKQRDDVLRDFAFMPRIDSDTWEIGTGGTDTHQLLPVIGQSDYASDSLLALDTSLEKMEKQVNFLMASWAKIEAKLASEEELRSHTPSIMPIAGGVITSSFGLRVDPFIQKLRHHNGIDIVGEPESEVMAPAAGVVGFARDTYKPNESFGKVVIIDHGYGIKTRYGHLKEIWVRKGQKVKRFDAIGQIGSTGRSTGVHLHYEVIVHGRFKNPEFYILN